MEQFLDKLYSGGNLTFDQSHDALSTLMAGQTDPAVVAAFLVALKLKGETPAEIAGAARALQDAAVPIRCDRKPLLDTCGTGGDGCHTINISTGAAMVLAAAGIAVAKHGNRAVSSRAGSADVLEALGIPLDLGPKASETLLDEVGIAFLFAPRYHVAMKNVMPVRQALKTRTIFNLIGPLSNPARPTAQVVGVFKEDLLEPMAMALDAMGIQRAFVVHGSGMDEICLHGPTTVVALSSGELSWMKIDPVALGIEPATVDELAGGDAAANAAALLAVLEGRDTGPAARAIALNAAAGLVLAGKAVDWREGYDMSIELLNSGVPARLLACWAQAAGDLA